MEETSLRILRPRERGAALVLALLALTVLLPIALILSNLVLLRQRQVRAFRAVVAGKMAAAAGLDLAMDRLRTGVTDLREDEENAFASTDLGPRAIDIRVIRQHDVVLTQGGDIIPIPPELKGEPENGPGTASAPGASAVPAIPGMTSFKVYSKDVLAPGAQLTELIPLYRRLAVYVVEAKTRPFPRLPEVRLLAVVLRTKEGHVTCVGRRYDRGSF